MAFKQNKNARARLPNWHRRWHKIPQHRRLAGLGSTSIMLMGILYSLTFAGAQSTVVSFDVSTSSSFPINLIAIPEKRIPGTGNNGTLLTVEVRNIGNTTPLYSATVNTGSGGTYSGLTLNVSPGTYDITAKGFSHLRTKRSSIALANNTTVDFTAAGVSPLLCGDVNSTDGDNKVNGIDLTLLVAALVTYGTRYDLNRDGRVNGIDLTNAVSNLNVTGAS